MVRETLDIRSAHKVSTNIARVPIILMRLFAFEGAHAIAVDNFVTYFVRI
jgi:hypothetical protein